MIAKIKSIRELYPNKKIKEIQGYGRNVNLTF